MKFDVSEAQIKASKLPHDIFLLNMIGNHILLFIVTVGMFAHYPWPILSVPLFAVATILFIFLGGRRALRAEPWYVKCHWVIAMRRTRIYTIALAVLGTLAFAGYLVVQNYEVRDVTMIALSGVLILPTMITVLVLIVYESESLYRAGRGELPEWMVARYPNPGVAVIDEELPPAIAAERAAEQALREGRG